DIDKMLYADASGSLNGYASRRQVDAYKLTGFRWTRMRNAEQVHNTILPLHCTCQLIYIEHVELTGIGTGDNTSPRPRANQGSHGVTPCKKLRRQCAAHVAGGAGDGHCVTRYGWHELLGPRGTRPCLRAGYWLVGTSCSHSSPSRGFHYNGCTDLRLESAWQ